MSKTFTFWIQLFKLPDPLKHWIKALWTASCCLVSGEEAKKQNLSHLKPHQSRWSINLLAELHAWTAVLLKLQKSTWMTTPHESVQERIRLPQLKVFWGKAPVTDYNMKPKAEHRLCMLDAVQLSKTTMLCYLFELKSLMTLIIYIIHHAPL